MWGRFEPVLNATTVGAFISALVTLLVAFKVPLTEEQQAAIIGMGGVIIAIFFISGATARNAVTPTAKVVDNIIPLVPAIKQPVALARLQSGKVADKKAA